MDKDLETSAEELGLLAVGSSRCWEIAIDESLNRAEEWYAELESPQTYLIFQLRDLEVLSEALNLLQSCSNGKPKSVRSRTSQSEDSLTLGKFGASSVSLVRDNEEFPRCFLVVGPRARSTLRLNLGADDIQMLTEALRQVVQDLPSDSGSKKGRD